MLRPLHLCLMLLCACSGGKGPSPVDAGAAEQAFQRGRAQQLQHAGNPSNERLNAAIEYLEEACRLDETRADYAYFAGRAREEHGDLLEARAHYEAALALDGSHRGAHWRLGGLLHQEGELEAARSHLEAAQPEELGENAAQALFDLGWVLEELGELESARDHYRRAVELRVGLTQAWYRLSRVLEDLGDPAGARQAEQRYQEVFAQDQELASARHAARSNPSDGAAWWTVARLAADLGRTGEARAALQALLALEPKNARARSLLDELEDER